jgi:hypothetical protein
MSHLRADNRSIMGKYYSHDLDPWVLIIAISNWYSKSDIVNTSKIITGLSVPNRLTKKLFNVSIQINFNILIPIISVKKIFQLLFNK